jgi:CBS domain-containing protein
MLKLTDIMTTEVATVTPETTLKEAVELFAEKHISGAPVVTGNRVVGVVTAADVLGFVAWTPGVPTERPQQTQWDDPGEPAEEDEPDRENAPAGAYFTDFWDDAGAQVTDRIEATEGPEWNVLDEHTVDEVMTQSVVGLPPNRSVLEAADLMQRQSVHRVLVIDDARLVGIVSALDVARAVAEHRLTTRQYVFNRDRDFGESRFPK